MQVSADLSPLVEGYRRFRASGWHPHRDRWSALKEGQEPRVMVIACSDSRVDPAQVFDTAPGEIFVVRNVAALVPPFETTAGHHGVSAAVEFAVQVLGVGEIVVMGHGMCGGCKAALSKGYADAEKGAGGFVADWIAMLDDAQANVAAQHGTDGREAERAMEMAAVGVSIENLRTFPFVADKVESGALRLTGAFFAISDGLLHLRDPETGTFAPVE